VRQRNDWARIVVQETISTTTSPDQYTINTIHKSKRSILNCCELGRWSEASGCMFYA